MKPHPKAKDVYRLRDCLQLSVREIADELEMSGRVVRRILDNRPFVSFEKPKSNEPLPVGAQNAL